MSTACLVHFVCSVCLVCLVYLVEEKPDEPDRPRTKCGVEAPSGVEPLHRSFADCSLNHLGTAPRAHYSLGTG